MKPLFQEKTLAKALHEVSPPPDLDAKLAIIEKWIATLTAGTLDVIKEVSLHGEFLHDIFGEVLGYQSVIQGEGREWTLHSEANTSDGDGSADGALGFFSAVESVRGSARLKGRIIAPIELKGATNDLDRPAHGRRESAVEQGWRYANYSEGCRWVIVSNYRELRLYRTSKTPAFYERFLLRELTNPAVFRRFYFILSAANFLPSSVETKATSRIDLLLRQSDNEEEKITDALYCEYRDIRLRLVQWLQRNTPTAADTDSLIGTAQRILDRVLFVAFCEDRGLLPANTIKNAREYSDPYNPTSIWTRYKTVFRWVNEGNQDPPIPQYDGGLFRHDPIIDDQIELPDILCSDLNEITRYDYDTDVSVEVLGHIFEQSITDLEELKAISSKEAYDTKKGRRKTQGIYYTPPLVTQYIVDVALGSYLRRKEEELRERLGLDEIPEAHSRKLLSIERGFWKHYRDVLEHTRVLDPACGSGAFLIAAFDYLLGQYERVNNALASFEGGQHSIFDLNRTILNNNLYGVDVSRESVEITKLSLWLQTAEKGKQLTFLDDSIQVGDSIVADPTVTPEAFDWEARFPKVFSDGGFDVVIGNPPYVRQELLRPIKSYLEEHYASYDGVADLYTYFYERGIECLKPGGMLSFVVTNKWLKAGYGEALRKYFASHSIIEQILDFGHAPLFPEADVFPCIISVRKRDPAADGAPSPVRVCPVPREKLTDINLRQYVQQHGYDVSQSRFGEKPWNLDHPAVNDLMKKIQGRGISLKQYISCDLYYGIKTGFNTAFFVDQVKKEELTKIDPGSEELFAKYLRGQDIRRWYPAWNKMWMILLKSSADWESPWARMSEPDAERRFASVYPGLFDHFKKHEARLRKRSDQGMFWWELRSCTYYEWFARPKVAIQRIAFHSRFSVDRENYFINDSAIMLPKVDYWALACLHSPVIWYFSFRCFPHKKDEALAMDIPYVEELPIPSPSEAARVEAEDLSEKLIALTKLNQNKQSQLLDWVRSEMKVDKPGNKLSDATSLDLDTFISEIKKRRRDRSESGLGVADVKRLKEAYNEIIPGMTRRSSDILYHERRLSNLVNEAFALTTEEVDLLWKTAPPRIPVGR